MDDDTEITAWLIIKSAIKFLISPVYFFIDSLLPYTAMFYFLTNIVFFHTFLITLYAWMPMFGYLEDVTHFFVVIDMYLVVGLPSSWRSASRKVQSISQMKIALGGLIVTVHVMNIGLMLDGFGFDQKTICTTFVVASFFLGPLFIYFNGMYCHLYVRLPDQQMPYSGIKTHVVVIGLLHVLLAVAAVRYTSYYPMCLVLIVSSFFFSVDAFCLFTTSTYMLCEHRQTKRLVEQYPGTIYHVAIRGKHETLPPGFQYHDELRVDQRFFADDYYVPLDLLSDILD